MRRIPKAMLLLVISSAVAAISQSSNQSQSTQPQVNKSESGKQEEAARAAARAKAHHFDRVLLIVLENVDYERAIQDPSLAALASQGASFTNFHALFHPSYPNYLAMIAGTDFGLHRRGSYLGDRQVNFPNDAAHRTIADRLIAAGLDFKQYAEELPAGTCPWNITGLHIADKRGNYVRRHVPFLSFREIQEILESIRTLDPWNQDRARQWWAVNGARLEAFVQSSSTVLPGPTAPSPVRS